MSIYGDGEYYSQMNNIYDEMECFLENHPVSELLKIIADLVERHEESEDKYG